MTLRPEQLLGRREVVVVGDQWVDAVVGYRLWRYRVSSGVVDLRSIAFTDVWPAGAMMSAFCACRGVLCTCGIHAFSQLSPYVQSVIHPPVGAHASLYELYVAGEVHLWGRIRVHEHGYRAQFARPACLYITPEMHQQVRMVVELAAPRYDIPIVVP